MVGFLHTSQAPSYPASADVHPIHKVSMHEPGFHSAQVAHFQHLLELLAKSEAVWMRGANTGNSLIAQNPIWFG